MIFKEVVEILPRRYLSSCLVILQTYGTLQSRVSYTV